MVHENKTLVIYKQCLDRVGQVGEGVVQARGEVGQVGEGVVQARGEVAQAREGVAQVCKL